MWSKEEEDNKLRLGKGDNGYETENQHTVDRQEENNVPEILEDSALLHLHTRTPIKDWYEGERWPPTERYEEVDGVRKEKERLTPDHQPPDHIFSFPSLPGFMQPSVGQCWFMKPGGRRPKRRKGYRRTNIFSYRSRFLSSKKWIVNETWILLVEDQWKDGLAFQPQLIIEDLSGKNLWNEVNTRRINLHQPSVEIARARD
jgi:hypothetical protein